MVPPRLIDLESPGSVRAENNTTDAGGSGSRCCAPAEVELLANTITGPAAEVGLIDRTQPWLTASLLTQGDHHPQQPNQENESAGIQLT